MKSKHALNGLLLATTALMAPLAAAAQEAGETTILPTAPEITDQIVVRGRNIPEPQRATSQVATFLSDDDLARTGDDNAALALTRLSGLSVVGGKFAYVRGLGDRYSAARLNGSMLPSPEPLRRTIPLDLFPSNILQGATVQKTFSANYPGDFGGGMIDLHTLRQPDESFANIKLGVGMNLVTTGHDGIFVNGGDLDFLGYDDGLRDIPDPLQALIDSGTSLNSQDPAAIETVGESLVNSPLSVIQEGTLGPNWEGSVDGGTTFDLGGDFTLGLVGVAGYKQDWTTKHAVRQQVANDILGNDFETTETNLDVTVNTLGSAALSWGEHIVQATGLYIHSTRKEAQINEGSDFNAPGTGQVLDESSSWLERQLWMGQLTGGHGLGDFEVNWRTAFARATRESPYEQNLIRNINADGVPVFSGNNVRRNIRFSELQDDTFSGGIDFIYNVPFSGPREATLSAGVEYSENDRNYDFHFFRFAGGNSLPLDVQIARPDFLFSPDNIDPARFFLIEVPRTSDSYAAQLITRAAYFQADAELIPTVRTTVGVRYEDADQTVQTFNRFAAADPTNPANFGARSELGNDYWLPSATLTWNFTDNMQLRLGYSQTVARPQFRELAQSQFFDPETERSYRGNGFLVDSKFDNYDARYEYYLGRNQFITIGGFYKEIDKPIEEIQFETATFVFDTTFINSPKARLFGGEFEYRTRFGISWNDWFERRDWLFSTNYTYTNSEITVKEGDVVINPFSGAEQDAELFGLDGAPLQGTPEHIANAQLGWEGEDDQFTVLVGWVDERILQRGSPTSTGTLPDVIEQPGVQLDAVYRYNIEMFGTPFTLGLAARNLLATDHEEFQLSDATESGRTEFYTYERGRTLSASLTARF